MHDIALSLVGFFQSISDRIGSGDVRADGLAVCVVLALACVLMSVIVYLRTPTSAPESAAPFDRFPWGGRIEKLEKSLNDLRTEALRSVELLKAEVHSLREQLRTSTGEVSTPPVDYYTDTGSIETLELGDLEPDASSETRSATDLEASTFLSESLSGRLQKTRHGFFGKLKSLFSSKPKLDEQALSELQALLISSDIGVKVIESLIGEVRAEVMRGEEVTEEGLTARLKMKILEILEKDAPLDSSIRPARRENGPLVVMMVGVNGVGKTTSVAKLAHAWKEQGKKVLMVAADTFRAAAVDQIKEWGQRIGVEVVSGAENAKPATVVFDAMNRALAEEFEVIVIDTAGRLHTKSNLMQELEGIRNAVERHQAGAPHETILVVDGSTGQNAIAQAKEFHEAVKLTGLIVTKLDGTPKGGVLVAIKDELGIPMRYIGVGESPKDLRPFIARDYVEALFDVSDTGLENGENSPLTAHAEVRRRRRENVQVV